MDIGWLWTLVGQATVAFGGVTVISLAIHRWLSGRLADKLYLKWKNDYDRQLETLRVQLSTMQGLVNTALSSGSQAYLTSQERVLKAVERAWESILKIHDYAFKFLFLYEILIPNEYQDVFSKKSLSAFVPKLTEEEFNKETKELSKLPEKDRPFLGEHLWVLLWVYRAAMLRLCWKLINERDNKRIFPCRDDVDGKEDTYLRKLLDYALSKDQIQLALEAPIRGPSAIMLLLEGKILLEVDKRVSGRHIAELNIEEGRKYAKALLEAPPNVTRLSSP